MTFGRRKKRFGVHISDFFFNVLCAVKITKAREREKPAGDEGGRRRRKDVRRGKNRTLEGSKMTVFFA